MKSGHSKERDKTCFGFLVKIFTKSLHREGVPAIRLKSTLYHQCALLPYKLQFAETNFSVEYDSSSWYMLSSKRCAARRGVRAPVVCKPVVVHQFAYTTHSPQKQQRRTMCQDAQNVKKPSIKVNVMDFEFFWL